MQFTFKRALGLLAVVLLPVPPALADGGAPASPPPPTPATARLDGTFALAAHVTVAVNVRGERAGQNLARTWTFTPTCASGICQTAKLVRQRGTTTDTVVLNRRGPGYYAGNGGFYAPLRCGGRVYPAGEAVPFAIAVHVTAATLSPAGQVIATRIRATYTNRVRRNRTPCLAILGHDAGSYHGHIVPAGTLPDGGGGPGGA